MDPRQKREDETWAEYGARIASMGITPTESYFAGPTVNQFRPTGSDYTPQQLNTPIQQLQQQNIPQNVVPITPVDPTLAGMGTVPAGISVVEEQVIPKTGHFGISQNYGDFSPQMGMLGDMVTDQPPMVDFSVVTDDPSRPVDYSQVFTENMPTATLPAETELQIMDSLMPNVQPVQTQDTGVIPATYTETTDTGEVVPMSNENLSFFGAAPVPTSPSMNVDYSQALADAGMAEVFPHAVTPEEGEVHDVHRHMGLTMGIWPEVGDPTNLKQQFTNTVTQLPAWVRKDLVRDRHDTIEQFLDDETTTDKLQDLINNQIAEDTDISFTNQGLTQLEKYHQAVDNPNVVYDKDSLNAMVELAKKDYYKSEEQVQEAINEIKSGVDTFKDIPAAPAKPAGPTRAELKAAAAAQRKADLAAQKAAARRAKIARQALKDSQAAAARAQAASAAQAKSEQAKAKAVLARAAGRDKGGPSQAEINAAIEVMSQVDTFGGGGLGIGGFDPQGGTTGSSGMGNWT